MPLFRPSFLPKNLSSFVKSVLPVKAFHPSPMVIRPIMTSTDPEIIQPRDPNTLSNYQSWRTQHVTANLEIDFEKKRLWGNVILKMKALRQKTEEKIVLDSRYVYCFRTCVQSRPAPDVCSRLSSGSAVIVTRSGNFSYDYHTLDLQSSRDLHHSMAYLLRSACIAF